jgi:protein disulfide-isomerase
VIAPLVQYIELFGKKEKTHLWKIHLMISKYLFRKDRLNLGLKYAKKAFRFAPKIIRKEIIQVINEFHLEIENRAKRH